MRNFLLKTDKRIRLLVLGKINMILCLDLDNVICKTRNVKYKNAKPIARTVKIINKAYNYKFKVLIFAGRFYGKCNGNLNKIFKTEKYNRTKSTFFLFQFMSSFLNPYLSLL